MVFKRRKNNERAQFGYFQQWYSRRNACWRGALATMSANLFMIIIEVLQVVLTCSTSPECGKSQYSGQPPIKPQSLNMVHVNVRSCFPVPRIRCGSFNSGDHIASDTAITCNANEPTNKTVRAAFLRGRGSWDTVFANHFCSLFG